MPIDFLGKNGAAPKSKKTSPAVSWHVPVKEKEAKKTLPKKDIVLPEKKKQPLSPELPGEVNLVVSFKRYILKKRLIFLLIFAILIIVGFIGYYFLQPYFGKIYQQIIYRPQETPSPKPSPEPLTSPSPAPSPIVSPTPSPIFTPPPTPSPIFTPTPSPTPIPTPLPDTELAPLLGTLVKFSGEEIIYLVEQNGELRQVDRQTVVFANGQRINQVSADLIYIINDQFRNIRRGKDVYGQVDWDPRILSEGELEPFL